MWFRLRLDIGYGELARAGLCALTARDGGAATAELELRWKGPHPVMSTLSVRSGFDLLLSALDLPQGSVVLMSALTIPDMVEVVRAHGLEPVALDVDPCTARVDEGALLATLCPRTRVVLVAHMFGDVAPLEGLVRALRGATRGSGERQVLLVEDCAQAFAGLDGYAGHPAADVSMFSFGLIKTATALGGALIGVRDPELLRRMGELQDEWPVQARSDYLRRVFAAASIRFVTGRRAYDFFTVLARALGRDLEQLLVSSSRSFGGAALLERIRRRPSAGLSVFLARRLGQGDPRSHERRRQSGEQLAALLELDELEQAPGHAHGRWIFPVLVDRPVELKQHLRGEGFDSTAGHSLAVVPEGHSGRNAGAVAFLERVLFVPAYAAMPARELERQAREVRAWRAREPGAGCAK